MTKIVPTVGRIVWYWPEGVMLRQPRPAMVTYVHDDSPDKHYRINLVTFDYAGNAWPERDVLLIQEGDERPASGFAEWMPYQVGQAKKHAASEGAAEQEMLAKAYCDPTYSHGLAGESAISTHLRAQLLALAAHHYSGGDTSRVLSIAAEFEAFVNGRGATPQDWRKTFEQRGHGVDDDLQHSDALAASDAEAANVQKPNAARVSYPYMMSRITTTHFTYPPACPHMTVAEVTFDNGFTIIGSSAPADPANFDVKLGQKFALENAMRQAWPLFGFHLCEMLRNGFRLSDYLPAEAPNPPTPADEMAQELAHSAAEGSASDMDGDDLYRGHDA